MSAGISLKSPRGQMINNLRQGLYGSITKEVIQNAREKIRNHVEQEDNREGFHITTRTCYSFKSGAFESDYNTNQDARDAMQQIVDGLIPPDVDETTKSTDDLPNPKSDVSTALGNDNKEGFTVNLQSTHNYKILANEAIETNQENQHALSINNKGELIFDESSNSPVWQFDELKITNDEETSGNGKTAISGVYLISTMVGDKRLYLYTKVKGEDEDEKPVVESNGLIKVDQENYTLKELIQNLFKKQKPIPNNILGMTSQPNDSAPSNSAPSDTAPSDTPNPDQPNDSAPSDTPNPDQPPQNVDDESPKLEFDKLILKEIPDIKAYKNNPNYNHEIDGFLWYIVKAKGETTKYLMIPERFANSHYVMVSSGFDKKQPKNIFGFRNTIPKLIPYTEENDDFISYYAWILQVPKSDDLYTLADFDDSVINYTEQGKTLPITGVGIINITLTTCAIIDYTSESDDKSTGYLVIANGEQDSKSVKISELKDLIGNTSTIKINGAAIWSIPSNTTDFKVYKMSESFNVLKWTWCNFWNNFITIVIILMIIAIGVLLYKCVREAQKPPSELQSNLASKINTLL